MTEKERVMSKLLKTNYRKLRKKIYIKKYSKTSYLLLRGFNCLWNVVLFLLPLSFIFVASNIFNLLPLLKLNSDELNFELSLTIFSIGLTFFAASLTIVSIIFSRKREQIFNQSNIGIALLSQNILGQNLYSLLISLSAYIVLAIIGVFVFSPALLLSSVFYIIVFSLLLLFSSFIFLVRNPDTLYYKHLRQNKLSGKAPRFLSKYMRYPNHKSFFYKNDAYEVDIISEKKLSSLLDRSKYGLTLTITLSYAKEKIIFTDTSPLEDANLIYFFEKYIKDINNDIDFAILLIVLRKVNEINDALWLEEKRKTKFVNINYRILNALLSLPDNKFIKKYNEINITKNLYSEALLYLILNVNKTDKFNDMVSIYLKYKTFNYLLFRLVNTVYIKRLSKLIGDDEKYKYFQNLINKFQTKIENLNKQLSTERDNIKSATEEALAIVDLKKDG